MEDPAEVMTPPGVEVPADGVPPSITADLAVPAGGGTTAVSSGAGRCSDAAAVTAARAAIAAVRGGADRGRSTDVRSGSAATGDPAMKLLGAGVVRRSE